MRQVISQPLITSRFGGPFSPRFGSIDSWQPVGAGAGNIFVSGTGNAAIRQITPAGLVQGTSVPPVPTTPSVSINPPTASSVSPSSPSTGGGGSGGGATSEWFLGALACAGILRAWRGRP